MTAELSPARTADRSPGRSPNHPSHGEQTGTLAYIAGMVLLGSLGIFVQEAALDTVAVVFFRCAFGALALGAYCLRRGFFERAQFSVRNLRLALFSGVLMVVNWLAFFEAIRRVGITVATIVFHVQPFLVLLIGAAVFRERVTFNKMAWMALGFGGLVAATGWTAGGQGAGGLAVDSAYLVGIGCTLAGALAYAGVTVTTKAMRGTGQGMRPHLTALIHCLVGAAVLPVFVPWASLQIGAAQWGWLAGLGSIHTALAYVLIYGALPKLGTASIAVYTFIYPAAAVGFDFAAYGHAPSATQLAGLSMIVMAGLGVSLGWGWRSRVPRPGL